MNLVRTAAKTTSKVFFNRVIFRSERAYQFGISGLSLLIKESRLVNHIVIEAHLETIANASATFESASSRIH